MRTRLAAGGIVWLVTAAAVAAGPFSDPAPPTVSAPAPGAAAPAAKENADVTFHAAPRALAKEAVTQDWPCFLGPTHNGISTETKLLKEFPKGGPKIVWEVAKGQGYSAPAIFGERLVLFHRVGDEEVVDCLDRETGRLFWRFSYPTAYGDRYGYSDGPRAGPAIDPASGRVYTYGAEGKLHCLDLATGHCYWRRDLLKEFKLEQNFFGVGAAPLIEGDVLIINVGADGGPSVAGFDLKTGKMLWGAGDKWGPSYAAPVPAVFNGKRRVLVFAGGESRPPTGGLMCVDPKTGAVDFEYPHRSRTRESVNASAPVLVGGNRVFISECYGAGGVMLEVGPDFKAKEIWQSEKLGTHFMTAIYKEGFLYGFDGHGPLNCPLVCLDARSGDEKWREDPVFVEQLDTAQGPRARRLGLHRSQLLHLPGESRTLCLTEWGHLLWLDLNPNGYKELSRTFLFFAGETWTPPVVSHGLLYVCQNSRDPAKGTGARLICYDLRRE